MNKKKLQNLLNLDYVWFFITTTFMFFVQMCIIFVAFLVGFINCSLTIVQLESFEKILIILLVFFLASFCLTAFLTKKRLKDIKKLEK